MPSEEVPEKRPLHVLILEDNPLDAELIRDTLEEAGILFVEKRIETEASFHAALGDFIPDLILSDYHLPQFDGARALSLAKGQCPDVPFILVTGALGEERAIDILTGGATDYVLKNRLSRLVPAVKRALQEAEERKERRRAEEERDRLLRELEEAVEQQRLLGTELLLTEVRERRRIAEDLHDNICQSLAVAKLRLQNLQGHAAHTALAVPLEEVQGMIEEAIHHTRSLLQEISPSLLYELGLPAALDGLAEQVHAKYGLAVILEAPQTMHKIDEEIQILLFQAVRELLMNIVKHAQVDTAFVSMQEIGRKIRIEVKDQGVGFDVSGTQTVWTRSGGFGLFNIRERLNFLGGNLEIHSGHEMGTRTTISAPRKTPHHPRAKGKLSSKV